MTNAEKYLKDGVDEDKFVKELHHFWWANEYDVCEGIRKFLHTQAKKSKPTLTEDERVILRNIDKHFYTKIFRDECLFLRGEHTSDLVFTQYDHLFQFINNGEEYSIKELLRYD